MQSISTSELIPAWRNWICHLEQKLKVRWLKDWAPPSTFFYCFNLLDLSHIFIDTWRWHAICKEGKDDKINWAFESIELSWICALTFGCKGFGRQIDIRLLWSDNHGKSDKLSTDATSFMKFNISNFVIMALKVPS